MKTKFLILFLLIGMSAFSQTKKINLKGFGDIPVSKQGDNYLIKIGNFGEFAFQGDLESQELEAKVKIDQLANVPGFKVLAKMGLTDITLSISNDSLKLNAKADTKTSLKKVCDLFKMTTPYIELNASITPKFLELKASLDFDDGPVEFLNINETGTNVKFQSAEIATKLEPGSLELGISTELLIKPSSFDPELKCIYTFSYDIVSFTLTGAGSMMSEWINPLGSSKFLPANSIIFSNAAVQLGINVTTLVPVDLGFAIEHGKIFTIDFGVAVSIDPVDKKVAFLGQRDKMNANDFTTFLREGFGLGVPNVLPDIYYIEEPLVLFSPNGGDVGEVEIEKGMALNGIMHIGDAIQGPINFKFDMKNELELHMALDYDFKKFVMNEVRKIKILAPLANEVLNTFQVRKLYVDLYANKADMNLNGKAKCDFEVFGRSHNIEFQATLDPEAIAKIIVKEITKLAGPEIAAVIEVIGKVVGPALNAAKNTANAGLQKAGTLAKNAYEWKNHLTHGDDCYNTCIPNRARELYTPVLASSNQAVNNFYSKVILGLRKINGNTASETVRLRSNFIKKDWDALSKSIDINWEAILDDKKYWGFDKDQADVERYGVKFKELINVKYQEHKNLRANLWGNMMNVGPFDMFVHYDAEAGCGTIYNNGKEVNKHCGWNKNWHTVLCMDDKALFYDKTSGSMQIYSIDENGNMALLQNYNGNISKTWESITYHSGIIYFKTGNYYEAYTVDNAGNIHNCTMKVEYDKNAGCASISRGGIFLKKHCGWNGWHTVLCMNDKILFYNKAAGNIAIYSLAQNGDVAPLQNLNGIATTWDHITYDPSGKVTFVLANGIATTWDHITYDPAGIVTFVLANGYHEAYHIDKSGNLSNLRGYMVKMEVKYDKNTGTGRIYRDGTLVKTHTNWSKGWNTVLCMYNKVLFYEKAAGNLQIYSLDESGNMNPLQNYNGNIAKVWERITYDQTSDMVIFAVGGYQGIYSIDNSGNLINQTMEVKYDKNAGCASISRGGIFLKKHCGWNGWHTVLCMNDKILFYNKAAGNITIYSLAQNGDVAPLQNLNGIRKTWDNITYDLSGIVTFIQGAYREAYTIDKTGNLMPIK